MNVLWFTDGTVRKEFERRKDIPCRLALLEEDYRMLMRRVMDMAECIRYFNLKDLPEGYWRELFRYQPLAVLSDIERVDTHTLEKQFLKAGRRQPEVMLKMVKLLTRSLEDWEMRLSYYPGLQLSADLLARVKFGIPEEKRELKRVFYVLLETLRKLQANYDAYLEEIRQCGENDPSLAILDTFLRHYKQIAGDFNIRWQQLPDFYFREVLQVACRGIVPDHIWLSFTKVPGTGLVAVEQGTAFIGGKREGGMPVCYRSMEDVAVGDIKLVKACSYFQEKNEESFPAARLDFVTGLSWNTIDVQAAGIPQKLFGESSVSRLDQGLMIGSPMLLLREGKRKLTVSFHLTEESAAWFHGLVARVLEKEGNEGGGGKLLRDAFVLELTTENGWQRVPEYTATGWEQGVVGLVFCLEKEFPATVIGDISLHGLQTESPLLRIRMNPEAWLFPYSWMTAVKCSKVKIHTEVTGLTALKIYSSIGELDTSIPFYPFGVQPVKGAQLVFGNYEMAVKPLQRVHLCCRWLQLPSDPEGFYGYYREYNRQIDNCSFRVKTEWLESKKWKAGKGELQCMFGGQEDGDMAAKGALPAKSSLSWHPEGNMPVYTRHENEYAYGKSSSGFFRLVLESPQMAFGHSLYPSLFAEVMLANTRRRHPLPVPAPPVSPLLESVEAGYDAVEEICFAAGQIPGGSRIFYMEPGSGFIPLPVSVDRPFFLAKSLGGIGNLLLGFEQAAGMDRIRFYVDMAAIRQEMDVRDGELGTSTLAWYIKQGKVWYPLDAGAVVRDSTVGFINSGVVELLLPVVVAEEWLDPEGIFWLCAQFSGSMVKQLSVKGIYTNVVEAVLDPATAGESWEWSGALPESTVVAAVRNIPGVAVIRQIAAGKGGRKKEDKDWLKVRMVHRIRHRNRAVTPPDFEDLVLGQFPEVAKVKCLPGLDSKPKNRPGIVTLVVVPRSDGKMDFPLCTHELLAEIESFLKPLAGSFVQVDAINPFYEEMKVRCNIGVREGWSVAETILRLRQRMDELIAPWKNGNKIPVFGYCFAMQELKNRIMEDEGVTILQGLSVMQVCRQGKRLYRLNEFAGEGGNDGKIRASCAWGIPVPSAVHLIRTDKEEAWQPEAGVGDLEVGDTFVIRG